MYQSSKAMPSPTMSEGPPGYTLKRADSIPSSAGPARPPPLPPSPTESTRPERLSQYTWDVTPPTASKAAPTEHPASPKRPESPVLSYSETFVNDTARNQEGEKGPCGRTYIFRFIPSRIGVALFGMLMFICSIVMAVAASLIANRLEGHLSPVQRLAIVFQILNYLFVTIASLVGLYAVLNFLHRGAISPLGRARKACQIFCGLLLGHLPFSVASGALSIHIVFKATSRALETTIRTAEASAASVDASSSEGAEQAAIAARALFELIARSAEAGSEEAKPLACWALEGSPLYWMCKKNSLIKALIIILYLALWFLEVVALYAGTRYSTQLTSAKMIKDVDDEEAADY